MQIKEFLNCICEQIKYKPVREEISKELEDHINDIKEDLISSGMNHKKAEEQAIKQMGNAEEIGKRLNKIHHPKFDWQLAIITLVLMIFGFVVAFTKTSNVVIEESNYNFWVRFIIFTAIGSLFGIGIYFIDYKKILKYSTPIYMISTGIVLYSLFFGAHINGIPFIRVGIIFFSASVISVPLYIISFVGYLVNKNLNDVKELKIFNEQFKIKYNILKLIILSCISIFMFLLIPSIASAIVLLLSYLILSTKKIILTSQEKVKKLLKLWGTILILGMVLMISIFGCVPYKISRIEAIINPEKYANAEGWQALNRKLIINSAQAFGEAEDTGNALDLFDEGDNFAFISILAHYGWVLSIALVISVIAFSVKLILDSIKMKEEYGGLLILGISTMFILESLFNILMNLNLWIEANFNIPFISYGGSSMIINLTLLGFIMAIYKKKDVYMYEKSEVLERLE